MNFLRKIIRNCFLFFITLSIVAVQTSSVYAQAKTQIVLVRGGDPIMRKGMSRNLTKAIQEMNKVAENKGDLFLLEQYCTEDGFQALNALVNNTGFYTTAPKYSLTLIGTPSGNYEVRGITGRASKDDTEGDPIKELVFVLNWQGFITSVHFAIENHHYQTILSQGEKLNDQVQREQVLNFLEQFRTAYNIKDIGFLEKTYSDDALIIVGRVIKTQQTDINPWISTNSERIEFLKKSKKDYIAGLKRAFKYNSFVKVEFDSVSVIQHPKKDKIYGITLKQRWHSTNYSDEGYLFIMMDFRAEDSVLIRVRSWQPERFEDGSVIDLSYFIIE